MPDKLETDKEYFGQLSHLDFGATKHAVEIPLTLSIEQAQSLGAMLLGAVNHHERAEHQQKPNTKRRSILEPIKQVRVWINTKTNRLTVNGL